MKNKFVFAVITVVATLMMASVVTVMAASVTPTLIWSWSNAWEQSYAGSFDYSWKFEGWVEGEPNSFSKTIGGNTITVTSDDGCCFDWTATLPISAVIVKTGALEPGAGPVAYLYEYEPPADHDTELCAPGGKGISHVTFCWNLPEQYIPEVPLGTITAMVTMIAAFGAYFVLRKPKSVPL
ncbi:MAG: hypothetical protein QW717_06160 [Candidatus Bathyarchaeia archaeon]